MKLPHIDLYSKIVLTLGVGLLAVIAIEPLVEPAAVRAQVDSPNVFIEPSVTLIRTPESTGQVQGKVVVDLKTGDIYGFPTASTAP